ncbi:hypothetical protein [Muriicola sp. Z0-33]|uniref:hypothetical protein n=1 Tax=Muriicola sp. Z0-33 TaxID=2816957 RepID=UPI0022377126|nr:hypothetical protein [Muriicola sp. Z0-33]MCW5515561.1 hypothetical protein [Muriicola sp. Z0-33]
MIHRSDIVSGVLPALTVLSGGYVLLNPSKEIRLVLFSLLHACVYIFHAPNTGNHAFFAFFVDLTIIITFCVNYWSSGKDRIKSLVYVQPILIAFTIILYFFAVFHKLNWSYMNPDSCGGTMLLKVFLNNDITSVFFGKLSSETLTFLKHISIYASLVLEMLIPIFLLFRRFSWIGCLLGILMHGILGFIYFWHFTPMLFALYVLFLPNSFFDRIYEVFQGFKLNSKNVKMVIWGAMLFIPILYVLKFQYPQIVSELGNFSRNTQSDWSIGLNIRSFIGWFPFLIYTLIFSYFVLSFPRKNTFEKRIKLPTAYYIFPLILILNGLSPYLGTKTHQSFSMFSGLMTHGERNNHLFMPNLNIVKAQNDIVIPCQKEHTNYAKQLRWRKNEKMVFYELQKRVTVLKEKGNSGIELCFQRNGKQIQLQNAELDSSLIIPLSWIDKKFRIYREIPINASKCYY